jgi:hypothetical protein
LESKPRPIIWQAAFCHFDFHRPTAAPHVPFGLSRLSRMDPEDDATANFGQVRDLSQRLFCSGDPRAGAATSPNHIECH